MSENKIAAPAVETIVPNATHVSFANFIRGRGYEVTDEAVALTFLFHSEWQASPERKQERESARAAKAAEAAEAKSKRDADRKARLAAEKAKLEAKLAKLAGGNAK